MLDIALNLLAQGLFGQVRDEEHDRLLQQPLRRRIYQIILRRPGIHASGLCREAGEPWGTVQYHLALLRKGSMVTSLEAGRERRFFPPDVDPRQARLLAILHQGRRQEILHVIRDNPGIRQVDVCDSVSVSRKTFRASIRPLVEAGLVEERKSLQDNRYFVNELPDAAPAPEDPPDDLYV